MWLIYILRLKGNSLYTGITNNLARRLDAHKKGKGSKYVRAHLPLKLVYIIVVENRSKASIIEANIKSMSKEQKEQIISSGYDQKDYSHIFCDNCGVVITVNSERLNKITHCFICNNKFESVRSDNNEFSN